MGVKSLDKKSDTWCQHCEPGRGCKIYETRPTDCREFDCLWKTGLIPLNMKPDRTKAVFAVTRHDWVMQVNVDKARPWRGTEVDHLINQFLAKGVHVIVCQGSQRRLLPSSHRPLPEAIERLIDMPA